MPAVHVETYMIYCDISNWCLLNQLMGYMEKTLIKHPLLLQ